MQTGAYLNLSDLLVSFSGVPWVALSSRPFLATRLPPAFTIDPEKKGYLQNQQDGSSMLYVHTHKHLFGKDAAHPVCKHNPLWNNLQHKINRKRNSDGDFAVLYC